MKRANKHNPLLVEITSKGKKIGTMTPEEFKTYGTPYGYTNGFLNKIVEDFNYMKLRNNEPERAKIVLNTN